MWQQSNVETGFWSVSLSGQNAVCGNRQNLGVYYSKNFGKNFIQTETNDLKTKGWNVSISDNFAIAGSRQLNAGGYGIALTEA